MEDTLTFRGRGKFEIKLQKPIRADFEGEIVIVTLPVFAAGFPEATAQIEMPLSVDDAEHLVNRLQVALTMARRQIPR